ncbi:MAG TPA: CapA family protein [Alphaproteobacteria bacterium]|nr:CapA family protein [Alphaproteobacteria bacterium]
MTVSLFLCGDVMTGRGIDQILPHPADPRLFEPVVQDARDYVTLAQQRNGPIPSPVPFRYIWGEALEELRRRQPAVRIVNLETSITDDGMPAEKEIHYRMGAGNLPCLGAAELDCCVLANNHLLDWGETGLLDTLRLLSGSGIATAGAGADLDAALAPAILPAATNQRILVFGYGSPTAGVPPEWAARPSRPGISLLRAITDTVATEIAERARQFRRPGDLVLVSLHWGGNWGYQIPAAQRAFAHWLIESGVVDVVHGHSSHHFRPLEVWQGKLILYGCGDFLNDYEGIAGYEEFRGDLTMMYFPVVDARDGSLKALELAPLQIRRMRLERPSPGDIDRLFDRLNRECAPFGSRFELDAAGVIHLRL